MNTTKFRKSFLFRIILSIVLMAFTCILPEQPSYAQVAIIMPPPGQMVHMTRHFEPPQMIGLKVNLKDPFSFDFIMDQGENPMPYETKKKEFDKIIKYFLISLTMPNKDMWVNLSPFESKRIVPEIFGQTEMGRDLLAQDYILKQFTASLIYPEDGLGKKFWEQVYKQSQEHFGTTGIKINTFNKVWIVADHADVYQKGDSAFLVGSHLKVMLEQDYMAIEKHTEMFGHAPAVRTQEKMDARAKIASDLVRQIIVPAIEKEVNEGKSFAAVRQAYGAEIMATWFKKTLKESLLGQVFADRSKIDGQRTKDTRAMEKIYKQYLKAYKQGVFNYIKEDMAPEGQTVPRKYFSGGMEGVSGIHAISPSMVAASSEYRNEVQVFENRAMTSSKEKRFELVPTTLLVFALATAAISPALAKTPPEQTPVAGSKSNGNVDQGIFDFFNSVVNETPSEATPQLQPRIDELQKQIRKLSAELDNKSRDIQDGINGLQAQIDSSADAQNQQLRKLHEQMRGYQIETRTGLQELSNDVSEIKKGQSQDRYLLIAILAILFVGVTRTVSRKILDIIRNWRRAPGNSERERNLRLAGLIVDLFTNPSSAIQRSIQVARTADLITIFRSDIVMAGGLFRRSGVMTRHEQNVVIQELDRAADVYRIQSPNMNSIEGFVFRVITQTLASRSNSIQSVFSVPGVPIDAYREGNRRTHREQSLDPGEQHIADAVLREFLANTSVPIIIRNRRLFETSGNPDAAMESARPRDVGGINLSDENLTMNIKIDGAGMPLPAQYQDKAMMNLKGLTSVIREIVPVTPENVPALYHLLT